jgi:hypothetical protein
MHINLQSQPPGQSHGTVFAVVVHQNADVDHLRQFPDGRFERLLRVISRENYRDTFAIEHEFP